MNRRQLLAASTGCLGCLAGCTGVDLPGLGPDGRHPFADSTVTVRVEDRGTTDHDVEANATDVLDFWAAESGQYAGFEVDFERVAEGGDIVLAYVDNSEDCSGVENYSSDVLGCAPLLRPGNRVPQPVTAYVVAADRPFGSIRTTAKHEIGHVLGLGHDDEPREIMSNNPEDRIPRYEIRIEIWETVLSGRESAATAAQRLNEGIDAWNDEEYEEAVAAFDAAEREFAAAREAYSSARDRTADLEAEPPLETVDLPVLRAALDGHVSRMEAIEGVASTMAKASSAAADGEGSTARQLSGDARDQLAVYHDMEAAELRVVAVALGLVRGFDREDTGIGLEDESL